MYRLFGGFFAFFSYRNLIDRSVFTFGGAIFVKLHVRQNRKRNNHARDDYDKDIINHFFLRQTDKKSIEIN